MKPISKDKREIIIAAKERGEKAETIASWVGVATSSVYKILAIHKKSGNIEPKPFLGRPSVLTPEQLSKIKEAVEMKLYIQRFIHHIGGLPDFSALKFTKYNQYESLILPMVKYLETHGAQFHYGTMVTNIVFEINSNKNNQYSRENFSRLIIIIENILKGTHMLHTILL